VLDLAGNVMEWTASMPPGSSSATQFRVSRGGGWGEVTVESLLDYMTVENPRPMGYRMFNQGLRCAASIKP
jgi:formylglycine-generating enzyme required for sulfatase activity